MNLTNSFCAHWTELLARPVASNPDTRYVKGDRRYMKIQKPGKELGVARTPQKTKQSENIKLARLPPVSADSMPAMTMCVKVEVNNKNIQVKRNSWKPR